MQIRRPALLLAGALLATGGVSLAPTTASASPTRQPLPFPEPGPVVSCGRFDVLIQAPVNVWPFDTDTATEFHVPMLALYSGRLQFTSVGNTIDPTAPPIITELSFSGRVADLCSELS